MRDEVKPQVLRKTYYPKKISQRRKERFSGQFHFAPLREI